MDAGNELITNSIVSGSVDINYLGAIASSCIERQGDEWKYYQILLVCKS